MKRYCIISNILIVSFILFVFCVPILGFGQVNSPLNKPFSKFSLTKAGQGSSVVANLGNSYLLSVELSDSLQMLNQTYLESLYFSKKADKLFAKNIHKKLNLPQSTPNSQERKYTASNPITFESTDHQKEYFFMAGKPIFEYKENKIKHKPLSTLDSVQKKSQVFDSRLYRVSEVPSETQFQTHVFFEIGEHQVHNHHLAQIDRLIHFVQKTIEKQQDEHPNKKLRLDIVVLGYTDKQAFYPGQSEAQRKEQNSLLSEQRAQEIAHYLENIFVEWVDEINLITKGKGEELPPDTSDNLSNDPTRRLCTVSLMLHE